MSFGSRIKYLRLEKHISQAELGSVLGVSPNTISQYEADKRFPDQKSLITICQYFNVSSDYLLGLSDVVQPSISLLKLSTSCGSFSEKQISAINQLIDVFKN